MRRWGSRSGLQAVGGRGPPLDTSDTPPSEMGGPPLDTLASGLRIRRFRVEAGVLILITVRSPICDSAGFSERRCRRRRSQKVYKNKHQSFLSFSAPPSLSHWYNFRWWSRVCIFREREGVTLLLLLLPSFSYRVYIHGRGKGGRFAAPKGLCIVKCKPSLCAKQVSHKRFKAKDFIMFKYWLFL